MKKRNLAPLILFCVVFLAYSLYFVKVINTTDQLEPNSIAKTIKRALDEPPSEAAVTVPVENVATEVSSTPEPVAEVEQPAVAGMLDEPLEQYVDYRWLNVRENPTLASVVLEKIYQDDAVEVLAYPSSSWALVKTVAGNEGYVSRRYLSDTPPETVAPEIVAENVPEGEDPATPATASELSIYDLPVITYHHISDDTDLYPDSMVLPEINLVAQLDYLSEASVRTHTFHDFKKRLEADKTAPANGVILTFNGGYDDAYRAAEVLRDRNQTAVFFVSTDKIGTDGHLSWEQVKEMRSWGMEIGSMGVTGAYLPNQTDFYIRDEIIRSKDILEQQLGEAVISFAYSGGGYTDAIAAVVKEAGYDFARSANDGSRYTNEELLTIPTLRVFFPAGKRQFQAWLTP